VVQGVIYFNCEPGHGVLVAPAKVTLLPLATLQGAAAAGDGGGGESTSFGDELDEFGGFESIDSPAASAAGGMSGWTKTLTRDYSGGTPRDKSKSASSSADLVGFNGFGEEEGATPVASARASERQHDDDEYGGFGVSTSLEPLAAELTAAELADDVESDRAAVQRQNDSGEGAGGDLVRSRGKCGRCGMPVFNTQPRTKDTTTGVYFHDSCPVKVARLRQSMATSLLVVGARCEVADTKAGGVRWNPYSEARGLLMYVARGG
jgi:hypothetical protein